MSNPLGSNKPSSSDQPEDKPAQPTDATEKPATSLSISDLMSMKSQLGRGSSLSTSDTGSAHAPDLTLESRAQPHFEGLRTIDLSRFLTDKNIARDLSKSPSIENDGKDFTWQTTHMLDANANMGLTIPLGLRQHFQLRGVDSKAIEEQKLLEELKARLAELKGNSVNEKALKYVFYTY